MDHFSGLDLSVKETSVCILDDAGKILKEVKVASEPQALLECRAPPPLLRQLFACQFRSFYSFAYGNNTVSFNALARSKSMSKRFSSGPHGEYQAGGPPHPRPGIEDRRFDASGAAGCSRAAQGSARSKC
jgi:hypothetical protein